MWVGACVRVGGRVGRCGVWIREWVCVRAGKGVGVSVGVFTGVCEREPRGRWKREERGGGGCARACV